MNAISLFAGIGGFDEGLPSGVNLLGAYELDSSSCEIYERITGHSCQQSDLARHDLSSLPNCDLIFGGPPCQEFSSGSKRRGKDGERNLFPVAVKAIEAKMPAMFIFENVKGLIQGKQKPYFNELLNTFRSMGYTVDWRLLNAADYGVPQTRERVFIVGRRDGRAIHWPFPTHWNRESVGLFFQRWVSWGEALQDWLKTADVYTKPFPNWLIRLYQGVIPESGMFDGHQKGSGKTRQHRPMDEPSFTLVKSNEKSVVRIKVGETVYRLDVPGMAIIQTLPNVPGLTVGQIGNSVAPLQAAALFKALVTETP